MAYVVFFLMSMSTYYNISGPGSMTFFQIIRLPRTPSRETIVFALFFIIIIIIFSDWFYGPEKNLAYTAGKGLPNYRKVTLKGFLQGREPFLKFHIFRTKKFTVKKVFSLKF